MGTRQLGLEHAIGDQPSRAAVKRTLDEPQPRSGRGGRRPGAGRRPCGARAGEPHAKRPFVTPRQPVHVVLRVSEAIGRLRRGAVYRAVRSALFTSFARQHFRVIHISIQAHHLHLICEADDRLALANGVRGLSISVAHRLNRLYHRRGRVFIDRYHATSIDSPRQARAALAYVLNNWRHHGEDAVSAATRRALVDPYSSGLAFCGWVRRHDAAFVWPARYQPLPVRPPRSWILREGWKRWGAIALDEVPGPAL